MQKIRFLFIVLGALLSSVTAAGVQVGISSTGAAACAWK